MLAQLVEHVTFNDVADGSNPSQDTIFLKWALSSVGRALPLQGRCHWFESSSAHHNLKAFFYFKKRNVYAVVVQLVRMPACHAGGRGFEPHSPRHFANLIICEESDPFV